MPEANQYAFSQRELLRLLIENAGVREGRWMLSVNFGITPGNFGPSNELSPGLMITVTQVGIQRAPADAPEGLWLDAATVHPPKRAKS